MTIWASLRPWWILIDGDRDIWVWLLAFQYVLTGIMSGSIYGSGAMWTLMAVALPTSKKTNDYKVRSRDSTTAGRSVSFYLKAISKRRKTLLVNSFGLDGF